MIHQANKPKRIRDPLRRTAVGAAALAALLMLSIPPAVQAQGMGTGGIPTVIQRLQSIQASVNARIDDIQNQISAIDSRVNVIQAVQNDMEENTASHPMDMDVTICFSLGGSLGAETEVALKGELQGKGGVGADVYGNGADADLSVAGEGGQSFTLGGEGGIEGEACVKGWTLKFRDPLDGKKQKIVNDLQNHAENLRDSIVNLSDNFNLASGKMLSSISLLQNLDLNPGDPLQILNAGAGAFGGMASVLPLNPSAVASLGNPAQVVVQLGDKLSDPVGTICNGSLPPGLQGVIDQMCGAFSDVGRGFETAINTIHTVAAAIENTVVNSVQHVVNAIRDVVNAINNLF